MHDTLVSNIIALRYDIYISNINSMRYYHYHYHISLLNLAYDDELTFCLTPKEFIRTVNASPNASFVLSTWMLKSPTISALSALTNRSERKSANYFRKSVYDTYTDHIQTWRSVHSNHRTGLFCISDSVITLLLLLFTTQNIQSLRSFYLMYMWPWSSKPVLSLWGMFVAKIHCMGQNYYLFYAKNH